MAPTSVLVDVSCPTRLYIGPCRNCVSVWIPCDKEGEYTLVRESNETWALRKGWTDEVITHPGVSFSLRHGSFMHQPQWDGMLQLLMYSSPQANTDSIFERSSSLYHLPIPTKSIESESTPSGSCPTNQVSILCPHCSRLIRDRQAYASSRLGTISRLMKSMRPISIPNYSTYFGNTEQCTKYTQDPRRSLTNKTNPPTRLISCSKSGGLGRRKISGILPSSSVKLYLTINFPNTFSLMTLKSRSTQRRKIRYGMTTPRDRRYSFSTCLPPCGQSLKGRNWRPGSNHFRRAKLPTPFLPSRTKITLSLQPWNQQFRLSHGSGSVDGSDKR